MQKGCLACFCVLVSLLEADAMLGCDDVALRQKQGGHVFSGRALVEALAMADTVSFVTSPDFLAEHGECYLWSSGSCGGRY